MGTWVDHIVPLSEHELKLQKKRIFLRSASKTQRLRVYAELHQQSLLQPAGGQESGDIYSENISLSKISEVAVSPIAPPVYYNEVTPETEHGTNIAPVGHKNHSRVIRMIETDTSGSQHTRLIDLNDEANINSDWEELTTAASGSLIAYKATDSPVNVVDKPLVPSDSIRENKSLRE